MSAISQLLDAREHGADDQHDGGAQPPEPQLHVGRQVAHAQPRLVVVRLLATPRNRPEHPERVPLPLLRPAVRGAGEARSAGSTSRRSHRRVPAPSRARAALAGADGTAADAVATARQPRRRGPRWSSPRRRSRAPRPRPAGGPRESAARGLTAGAPATRRRCRAPGGEWLARRAAVGGSGHRRPPRGAVVVIVQFIVHRGRADHHGARQHGPGSGSGEFLVVWPRVGWPCIGWHRGGLHRVGAAPWWAEPVG